MELGDEILSTEQLSSFKLNQKKRNQPPTTVTEPLATEKSVPSTKYVKAIVQKPKDPIENPPLFVEPIQQQPIYSDPDSSDLDSPEDPDMPGLEFLDMEEELRDLTSTDLNERSPFIPGPFSDYDLKSRDINTLLADIDETELIDRAPYIPPPCIDKIVSFDDLSLPDLTDNYQDDLDESSSPSPHMHDDMSGNTAAFMDAVDNGQMYDLGNAKVPAHLIKKFLPMMSGKSDLMWMFVLSVNVNWLFVCLI